MRAISFRPPGIEPTPELNWVLARAFGRPEAEVAPPRDPAAAFEIATRLALCPRIGARNRSESLRAEMGGFAGDLSRTTRFAAASALAYEAAVQHLAHHAAPRRIPLILLKGGALDLLRVSPPGARSFGDLDVLVPMDRIVELRTALVASGWALSPLSGSEHQEAPLTHPSLGMVELHRCIPGVRPRGSRRSFDARALLDAGLTTPVSVSEGAVHVPIRPILVAHALVHGLVQHGFSPGSYPLLRVLADLQDLGAGLEELREAASYLRDFDAEDLEAVAALLVALESGAALHLPDGPARSLLHHLVAGALEPAYTLGLKSDPRSLRSPTDLPFPLAAARWVYKSIVLSRAQVDAIYGPPKRPGGYAARQLLRPFDLAYRLVRSLRAKYQRGSVLRSTLYGKP